MPPTDAGSLKGTTKRLQFESAAMQWTETVRGAEQDGHRA